MTGEIQARLFSWGARALYLGPALNLSPHRNAVAVLALALTGSFRLARDAENLGQGYEAHRSALIAPGALHHLIAEGPMAFLYLDAASRDLQNIRACCRRPGHGADFDLEGEMALAARLSGVARGAVSWADARAELDALLRPQRAAVDRRVRQALARMHAAPAARPSLSELAATAGLSTSRFIHLFKAATGVPLRRYKVWLAVGAAMRELSGGANLTQAALGAGFSSSAHFSSAFRDMFGMEPSRLAGTAMTRRS